MVNCSRGARGAADHRPPGRRRTPPNSRPAISSHRSRIWSTGFPSVAARSVPVEGTGTRWATQPIDKANPAFLRGWSGDCETKLSRFAYPLRIEGGIAASARADDGPVRRSRQQRPPRWRNHRRRDRLGGNVRASAPAVAPVQVAFVSDLTVVLPPRRERRARRPHVHRPPQIATLRRAVGREAPSSGRTSETICYPSLATPMG